MSSDNNETVGFSGVTLLLILFIALKLCNVIDWSWWWVLSPIWIPIVLLLFIVFVAISVNGTDKK